MEESYISKQGLEVELHNAVKKERLAVRGDYPEPAKDIFHQVGAMHLLSPYFPKKIVLDFPVHKEMKNIITAMYDWHEHPKPQFYNTDGTTNTDAPDFNVEEIIKANYNEPRAIISHSSGKDSVWNYWRAREEYGINNVQAVHIAGLNRANAKVEREHSVLQHEKFIQEFDMLDLLNSSSIGGPNVMISREVFLTGALIPYAMQFGAEKIYTEGFGDDRGRKPFSAVEGNLHMFNQALENMGLPVKVAWWNKPEMDVMNDLYTHEPTWMQHVSNCFDIPCYKPTRKKYWKKKAPSLKLYNSQCGSCVKCRVTTVGRLLYEDNHGVKEEDGKAYMENALRWYRSQPEWKSDFLTESLTRDMQIAARRYGINEKVIERSLNRA